MTSDTDSLVSTSDVTVRIPKRSFILEPLVFIFFFARSGVDSIMGQYVYTEIGKKYNYTQAGIGNNDNVTDCFFNTTDPTYILQQRVQQEAAMFGLLLSTVSILPAILLTLYMGGYTDRRGRRIGFLLPAFGICFQGIVDVLVVAFEADMNYIFIGSTVIGLTGNTSLLATTLFSYVADVTSTVYDRTKKILILEFMIGTSGSLASLVLGFWIQSSGFLWPLVFVTVAVVVCFVYSIFFIPETIIKSSDPSAAVIKILKDGILVLTKEKESRRPLKLFLLLAVFFLTNIVETQYAATQTLYMMDSPLCFNSTQLGIAIGVLTACLVVGATIGIYVFMKFLKMALPTVVLIGIVSAVGRLTVFGAAVTPFMVFIAIPVGLFEYLSLPLIRARLSKTVTESEQGSMFAVVESVAGVISLLGNLLWNTIYTNTLLFYPGFVFFVMAATEIVGGVFVCVYKIVHREEPVDGGAKKKVGEMENKVTDYNTMGTATTINSDVPA